MPVHEVPLQRQDFRFPTTSKYQKADGVGHHRVPLILPLELRERLGQSSEFTFR